MARLGAVDLITFDCYGTLVDWETGVRDLLRSLGGEDPALFDAYLATEAEVEAEPYMRYRDVLAETVTRLGRRFGFDVPDRDLPAQSLMNWQPFPDTNDVLRRLKERCKLGVLSNVDRDLFAKTAERLSVDFDLVVTAEDVGSYKPGRAHFDAVLSRGDISTETWLHTAQSLYHDCVPAGALGVRSVWINRRGESNETEAQPVATFANLAAFADAVCGGPANVG